ncbi:RlpA-like double-psi beta-barrel domain-containing protein [Aspergillus fischeri NRRL 181]|uniref:Riboflavin aldehyde-forming enzyme n=1 Tax=Neosartorya fischeri (strain ATCC 1020 / DSM 3700 / CBS 544.65 / FGSC A1164 / JCM 1740 / NRRL 181 / WB 181) TaxID=331117 RepID=A1DED9_NEOFI|nr:riboflavin aldehyde-forming enzyme [Aspergillus fischeri NRRL 181]EAW17746.1 riboflavin aldehyde-forming enzyme [Aspergillus fischeri NRRL 181]
MTVFDLNNPMKESVNVSVMSTDGEKPPPQLCQDASHLPFAAVPKRKPVPIGVDEPAAIATKEPGAHLPTKAAWWWNLNRNWQQFSRKKRMVITAIAVAVVCLLALVIGLAVGLTRGKGHSNLPLPTSHGGPYSGDLTYYNPGLGSCGITSTDSDMICAVSHVLFDAASTGSNPNANPLCGLKLRLHRGESSADVKIVDRCVGCKAKDLDVSPAVFQKLADMDLGRVTVEWSWLEDSPVASLPS